MKLAPRIGTMADLHDCDWCRSCPWRTVVWGPLCWDGGSLHVPWRGYGEWRAPRLLLDIREWRIPEMPIRLHYYGRRVQWMLGARSQAWSWRANRFTDQWHIFTIWPTDYRKRVRPAQG